MVARWSARIDFPVGVNTLGRQWCRLPGVTPRAHRLLERLWPLDSVTLECFRVEQGDEQRCPKRRRCERGETAA